MVICGEIVLSGEEERLVTNIVLDLCAELEDSAGPVVGVGPKETTFTVDCSLEGLVVLS